MARIIGITNRKGGTQKSSSTAHIGHGLALMGHKVLIIDTDTQGQAKLFFDANPDKVLTHLIDGSPMEDVIIEVRENLFLLGADRSISKISKWIASESINPQLFLKRKLKDLDQHFDYILIDGAPGFNELSVNVLFYADELIIPVNLELMAVEGLSSFIDELAEMEELAGTEFKYRLLPTVLDGRSNESKEAYEQLKEVFGETLMSPIRYSEQMKRCSKHGQTIFEFDPENRASADYVAVVEAL